MRRALFFALSGLLAWALLEGSAFVALKVLFLLNPGLHETQRFELREHPRAMLAKLLAGKTRYFKHSATLGWTLRPNGRRGLYQANAQGLRADREYARRKPSGRIRILTFGDSFTHGTDVGNADTWQAILMRLDPRFQVLNFGVGAYGLDQSLLRYQQDGRDFDTDMVMIGFLSENLLRNVSVFRPFYVPDTGAPLAKPRFLLANGLTLLPHPLPVLEDYRRVLEEPSAMFPLLGAHDYFYQSRYQARFGDALPSLRLASAAWRRFALIPPYREQGQERFYNPASEAYRVTTALFDRFYAAVKSSGAKPLIVVFPHYGDLRQFKDHGSRPYAVLFEYFSKAGYTAVDLMDGLMHYQGWKGKRKMFVKARGHYSAIGNEMVAMSLLDFLRQAGLDSPATFTGSPVRPRYVAGGSPRRHNVQLKAMPPNSSQ